MKKRYDLSVANQSAENRRILISDTGKEYDLSFRAAILNRKYYKEWTDYQSKIMGKMSVFTSIQSVVREGGQLTDKDNQHIADFRQMASDAAETGVELICYAMRSNGYTEFSEDELFSEFSEKSIALAIDFIMGLEESVKKK